MKIVTKTFLIIILLVLSFLISNEDVFSQSTPKVISVPFYSQEDGPNCWAAVTLNIIRSVNPNADDNIYRLVNNVKALDGITMETLDSNTLYIQAIRKLVGVDPVIKTFTSAMPVSTIENYIIQEIATNNRPVAFCSSNPMASSETDSGHCITIFGYDNNNFYISDPKARGGNDVLNKTSSAYFLYDPTRTNPRGTPTYNIMSINLKIDSNRLLFTQLLKNKAFYISKTNKRASGTDEIEFINTALNHNGYYLRDFITDKELLTIPKGYNTLTINPKSFLYANTYPGSVDVQTSVQVVDAINNKKSGIITFETTGIESNTFKFAEGERSFIDLNQFRDNTKKVYLTLNLLTRDQSNRAVYSKVKYDLILEPGKDDLIKLDYRLEDNLAVFTINKDTLPVNNYYCTWEFTRRTPAMKYSQEIKNENTYKFRFLTEGTYDVKLKVELDANQDFKRPVYGEQEIKDLYIPKLLDFNIVKDKNDWIIKPSLNFDYLSSDIGFIFTISEGENVLYISEIKDKEDLKYSFKKAGKYTILLTLYDKTVKPIEKIAEIQKNYEVTIEDLKQPDNSDSSTAASGNNNVELIIPKKLVGTDFATAKVKLSPDLEKITKEIYWVLPGYLYSGGKEIDNKNDKREVQFQVVNDSYTNKSQAFVRLYDETGKEIFISEPVDLEISKVGISISSSSIWEAGTDGKNAGGKRKPAVLKRMKDGNLRDSATIGGNVSIKWVDMLNNYDDAKLKAEYEPLVASGQYKEMRALNLQGFQGYLLINPVTSKYTGNQYGYVDLAYPEAQASVRGYIFKGKEAIKIEGSVYGGGTRLGVPPNFAYDDMPFVQSQTKTAFNELLGIINSVKIELQPKSDKFPYNGPALDGSDQPVVKLKADKITLKKGDIVPVNVIVENYSGNTDNLNYVWTGEHEGKGKDINFIATKSGKFTLSVVVDDSNGNIGTDSVEFEVEDLQLTISKVSPDDKALVYGSEVNLIASLMSDGKKVEDNTYIFHWNASENIDFEPQDSQLASTKVKLTNTGNIKIWVNVLKKEGEGASTVATSDQIELNVVNPKFVISLDKENPSIGENITASVSSDPDIQDLTYHWDQLSDNAKLIQESQDSKQIEFTLLNSSPVTLKVTAINKNNKDTGIAEKTLTAKGYDVSVNIDGPKFGSIKPVVWKEGKGLVEVESEYAVNQDINLSAKIKDYNNSDVIYSWEISQDCNIVGSDTGNTLTVNKTEPGSCEVKAIAKNSRGDKLGEGANTLTVSISKNDLDKATKIKGQVNDLIKQANDKANNGDLSGAINDANSAAQLNPKNPDIPDLLNNLNKQKDGLNNLINNANTQVNSNDITGANKSLDEIKKIDRNNPAINQIADAIAKKGDENNKVVEAKIAEIHRIIQEDKEFELALLTAKELRASHKLDQYLSDSVAKEETWANQQIQNKTKSKVLLAQGESKFNNKDFVGASCDFNNGLDVYDVWNKKDTEPQHYGNLRNQANENIKTLGSISSKVFQVVSYQGLDPKVIEDAIKDAKFAMDLSPVYEPRMPSWIKLLEDKHTSLLKYLADKQNASTNNISNPPVSQGQKTFNLGNNTKIAISIPQNWTHDISNIGDVNFYYQDQHNQNYLNLAFKTFAYTDLNNKNQVVNSIMNAKRTEYNASINQSVLTIMGQSVPYLQSSFIDRYNKQIISTNYFPSNANQIFVVSTAYPVNDTGVPVKNLLNNVIQAINSISSSGNINNPIINNKPVQQTPLQTSIKYIDNFNTGGCSYTDNAKIRLTESFNVTSLQIWYLWDGGEQSVPYKLLKDGQVVTSGDFLKTACDPYQSQWCTGNTNLAVTLTPGLYDIKVYRAKLCQNSTSLNSGFIKVFGNKSEQNNQATSVSSCNWGGQWNTNWGSMTINQSGTNFQANYTNDNGKISGTIQGNKMTGAWSEAPSYAPTHDAGDVILKISPDCNSFAGDWRYGFSKHNMNWNNNNWNGTRVSANNNPPSNNTATNSTTKQIIPVQKPNNTSNQLTNKFLNITFINQSGENIHFYGMADKCRPENKILPGGRTNTGVSTQFKILEYYVGRNGQTIGTVKIPVDTLKNGQQINLFYNSTGTFYWQK